MNTFEYSYNKYMPSFLAGVYGWMSCALILTALSSYFVATSHTFFAYIHSNPSIVFLLFLAQIILVVILSVFLMKISFTTALFMFFCYALSLGITLSSIFYVYTPVSIISTFVTTSLMFGAMSIYGYVTRSDLTTIGNMSIMALFGLIIGLLINMYFKNEQADYIMSAIGVIIFTLLTAYDTQKLKRLGQQMFEHNELMNKITILGALTLYLDFINLFLFLLRLTGKKHQE